MERLLSWSFPNRANKTVFPKGRHWTSKRYMSLLVELCLVYQTSFRASFSPLVGQSNDPHRVLSSVQCPIIHAHITPVRPSYPPKLERAFRDAKLTASGVSRISLKRQIKSILRYFPFLLPSSRLPSVSLHAHFSSYPSSYSLGSTLYKSTFYLLTYFLSFLSSFPIEPLPQWTGVCDFTVWKFVKFNMWFGTSTSIVRL